MAQLDKAALLTLMNDKLPDNTTGEISPEDVRDVMQSMIESANNKNDAGIEEFTTADLDALTNTVAALLLLTNFPAYAELYRNTVGLNSIPLAGQALSFDAEGPDKVLEYESDSEIKIVSSVGPTDFKFTCLGSVEMMTSTVFDVWLRVNGINVRQLGALRGVNNTIVSFAFGGNYTFDDGDLVQIWVEPDANNQQFDLQIGTIFSITRI
jgi:hypothetical protein